MVQRSILTWTAAQRTGKKKKQTFNTNLRRKEKRREKEREKERKERRRTEKEGEEKEEWNVMEITLQ